MASKNKLNLGGFRFPADITVWLGWLILSSIFDCEYSLWLSQKGNVSPSNRCHKYTYGLNMTLIVVNDWTKLLFTFRETKTVFANRDLKWEELIFFSRVESYNRNFNTHGNYRNEFTTFQITHANFKFIIWSFILNSWSTWKQISALKNTTGSTSGLKDWSQQRQFKENVLNKWLNLWHSFHLQV